MRGLLVIALFFLLSGIKIPDAQKDYSVFGVRISMSVNSQIVSYVAIRYSHDGILREKKNYNKAEFIRVLSGDWPSIFNPTKKNLFHENGIVGGVAYNDTLKQSITYCPIFDSLWKLRYSDYPMRNCSENGWSKGLYKPSSAQEQFLAQTYHFKQMDFEYIVDTNFWHLLQDVSNPQWVEKYKALP
jgi:hypothetical protein